MPSIKNAVETILDKRDRISPEQSLLVAVSGIDGSGKGFITNLLDRSLTRANMNVATINLDPWHHPQTIRFNLVNPGEHFYYHAFRWDELFQSLLLPLKYKRFLQLTTTLIKTDQDSYYQYTYDFKDIDIILFEGIFILKSNLLHHYDRTFWIDCSFQTALERSLKRRQEGLSLKETINAYQNIYFPAQIIHFAQDDPYFNSTEILINDRRRLEQQSYPDLSEIL